MRRNSNKRTNTFLLDAVVITVYHVVHSVIVEGLKDPDHLNGIQAVLFGIGKVSKSDIELERYQTVTSIDSNHTFSSIDFPCILRWNFCRIHFWPSFCPSD